MWHTPRKSSKHLGSDLIMDLSRGSKGRQRIAALGLPCAESLRRTIFGATVVGLGHESPPTDDRSGCPRELSVLECTTGLSENLYDHCSGDLRLVWIRGPL